ncbi:MAG: hypothetical protein RML40_10375 [Bacteroidota bacterium]|nr:hypothetical protein [Bacteroidota bacterium]
MLSAIQCATYQSSLQYYGAYNNIPQQPLYIPQHSITTSASPGIASPAITLQTFYDELSPYGEWILTPEYGYVWRPFDIDIDWRPYLHNGRWVCTTFGWTWISDYVWGWAPFHYGRWYLDPVFGWIWQPGTVWAPAWVEWRFWNGHYCWAPLPPGVTIGRGFRGSRYHWSAWSVVPCRFLTAPYLQRYCLPYSHVNTILQHTTIIANTTVLNNTPYFTGPALSDVERYSGKVTPMALKVLNTASKSSINEHDNSVSLYRPDVHDTEGKSSSAAFRPANAVPAHQARSGKASVLLTTTPEEAEHTIAPKSRPLEPTLTRDPASPTLTPPAEKLRPSVIHEESGNGKKPIPLPTPAEERPPQSPQPLPYAPEQSSPNRTTKPVEQAQPREVLPTPTPYTKPHSSSIPQQTTPTEQRTQAPMQKRTLESQEQQPYRKPAETPQQRDGEAKKMPSEPAEQPILKKKHD